MILTQTHNANFNVFNIFELITGFSCSGKMF